MVTAPDLTPGEHAPLHTIEQLEAAIAEQADDVRALLRRLGHDDLAEMLLGGAA